MEYKLLKYGTVLRLIDQAFIPADPANCDFQEYTTWLGDGNEPEPEESIAGIKARVWKSIKDERDRRKAAGVRVGTKWFHSDDGSRIQQMGLVMLGSSIPTSLKWNTMDGSFIEMTPTLATEIVTASSVGDQAIFAAAEKHKAELEKSEEPENYDYSTGWPEIFQEY
jgi:hypothetical protein